MTAFYLTHQQVAIDPAVPVPCWGLSSLGRKRALGLAATPFARRPRRIVASKEAKAVETASVLAEAVGVSVDMRPGLHENDRSATGYLPAPEFGDGRPVLRAPAREHPGLGTGRGRASPHRRRGKGDPGRGPSGLDPVRRPRRGRDASALPLVRASDRAHAGPAAGRGNLFAFDGVLGRVLYPWRALEDMIEHAA